MCVSSNILLALRVVNIASLRYFKSGIFSNAILFADSNNPLRCSFKQNTFPSYTLKPSQTASPPCDKLSKTEILASFLWYRVPSIHTLYFHFFCQIVGS